MITFQRNGTYKKGIFRLWKNYVSKGKKKKEFRMSRSQESTLKRKLSEPQKKRRHSSTVVS